MNYIFVWNTVIGDRKTDHVFGRIWEIKTTTTKIFDLEKFYGYGKLEIRYDKKSI